ASGSYAYAIGENLVQLRHPSEGPFCFTGWYHASGVKRPHVIFHVTQKGTYHKKFHFSSEVFSGAWHKVVYSHKLKGSYNVTISSVADITKGISFIAVDDLTIEPGPCPPAPPDGSCNFDWDDTCGYNVGNDTGRWHLNHWRMGGSDTSWTTAEDVTVGFGGGFAIFKPRVGRQEKGVLSSPKVRGHTGRQCLQFYYFVAKGTGNTGRHGLQVLVTGHDGSRVLIWDLFDDALLHDEWAPALASFDGSSSFQLDFECHVSSGSYRFYCGLDYIRLTDCDRPLGGSNQDCDFEGGYCSWKSLGISYKGNDLWTLGGGTTKTTLAKPSKDHTLGTSAGKDNHCSYLWFSEFQQTKGSTAKLLSEAIPISRQGTKCMEFQYIVAGDKNAKLRVKSASLQTDFKKPNNPDLLWEAEGGEFDTWLLGRVALSGNTRVIFEAVAGSGSPPGYIALDDVRIFVNDSCETFPSPRPEDIPVDKLLNCDFGHWSLCNWAFNPTNPGDGWRFGSQTLPLTDIGPTRLPAGVPGTFIYTDRATVVRNHGSLWLTSPKVPRQTHPVCATFRYHLFGALGSYVTASLLTLDEGRQSTHTEPFIFHRGRTAVDRWFVVRRTLDFKGKSNEIKVVMRSHEEIPCEMALGPVEFASGQCQFDTDSRGWCDFEYDTCDWTLSDPNSGWRRQSNSLKDFHSHARSGPPDSHFFLELRRRRANRDSEVRSPWFQGRPEPQCLKFWYRRDKLKLGKIIVELVPGGGGSSSVIWEQPPYAKSDWMLGRVPIAYEKEFQVVFRADVLEDSDDHLSSFRIDDLQRDPESCSPAFECDFEDDFCGYVNDFTYKGFQWLVGTGRVVNSTLVPRLPRPPSPSAAASAEQPKSWTRFAYVDLSVPTGRPSDWTPPRGAENANLVSPVFEVGGKRGTLRMTYFRSGPDIVTMELRQVEYNDDSGTPATLQTVQLPEGGDWQSTWLKLKPSKQSQVIVALTRGKGTNGIAAVGTISDEVKSEEVDDTSASASLSCDFEKGTFCGWELTEGDFQFKLNDPANKVPPIPKSDHTLQAHRGRFVYAERTGTKVAKALLKSPQVPDDVRKDFCVSLWQTSLPNTNGFIGLNDSVSLYVSRRDQSDTVHHWAHRLVQMKLPDNADRFTIGAYMLSGLIAVDDIEVTPGKCPLLDKCTFERGSPCHTYWEYTSSRMWSVAESKLLKVPDHTLQDYTGHFLYVNTSDVDPSHPEARVFLGHRDPTPATCVTFWWKSIGRRSDLNVYVHTKKTVLRDPVLSVNARPTPDWWNPRTVTVSSRTKWQLVFEAVSYPFDGGDSGVMVDDVEFADGVCPAEKACTFEEDFCIPWVDVTSNSSKTRPGWQVQRAGSFNGLPKDHTLKTQEGETAVVTRSNCVFRPPGYYLLYRNTGNTDDSAVLELRERRFSCATFFYFISESTDGCRIQAGDSLLQKAEHRWWPYTFDLSWGIQDGVTIRASCGTDSIAFVAIDDIFVDERQCSDLRVTVMDNFTCSNDTGEKVPMEKVCDFVKDCSNGMDEEDCGDCEFETSSCGWDVDSYGDKDMLSWQRRRVGDIPRSPPLNRDNDANGFYMILAGADGLEQQRAKAVASAPVVRNTDFRCAFTFWYNYANRSVHVDLILQKNQDEIKLWTLRDIQPTPPERTWGLVDVILGRYTGDVKLHFSGYEYPVGNGYFAVDEIQYEQCALPTPKNSSCEKNFKCANGACIPHFGVCNYVDNCGDGSDELNCGDYNLGCNFDSSFCDWKPVANNQTDVSMSSWKRLMPGRLLSTAPTRDHTTGLREGWYLSLRPMHVKVQAEIAGPILQTNGTCAITFFYTIYKGAPSTLILGVRYTSGGPLKRIWSRNIPSFSFDFQEKFVIFYEKVPFQVFFKGIHEATDETPYIAIDDVSFSSGCIPYHGTLPVAPTTPTPTKPPTCPDGQFTCLTSRQCIPQTQVCDFKKHCPDGSDENNCGACDFSTDLCGLTTNNPDAKFTWKRTSAADVRKNTSSSSSLPRTDSANDPSGFYVSLKKTNPDVPRGTPNALQTPPLGQVAHSCTVSFYAFLKLRAAHLWFGVVQNRTSLNVRRHKRFAVLGGHESDGKWSKMNAKVGNWNPGARFYFMTNQAYASIDAITYRGCHPDRKSETYEEELLVSCSFSFDDECGWFPENEVTELDWVKYAGKDPALHWQPPAADVGHAGPYMFITNHGSREARGHLVSKRLDPPGSQGRCFSFWYSMRHPNSGTLNVLLRSEDNSTALIWTRSGPQGRAWLRGYANAYTETFSNFVLEAVLPGSTPAVIAVDHIDVRGGQCKSKMVCDFDYDNCGWTLRDWEINAGNSIPEPSIDHTTKTGSGAYARLKRSNGRLFSPQVRVPTSGGSCVKFWYYLSGSDTEQLNVTREEDFKHSKTIWSVLGSQVPQKTWLSGSVGLLGHAGALSVAFTGTTSEKPDTAVAVDDIQIDPRFCAPPGSCTFEEGFCNWRNTGSMNRRMQWYRNSGPTMTPGGPAVDHTRKTADGVYLLLDSQDLALLKIGTIESELLSYGPDACFRLFYQIHNGSDAKINVQFLDISSTVVHRHIIQAPEKDDWTLLQQDVTNLPSVYRIRITASAGKERRSDVAIDDIEVFSGKCSKEPVPSTEGPRPSTRIRIRLFAEAAVVSSPHFSAPPSASGTTAQETTSRETTTTTSASSEPGTPPAFTCGPGELDCRDNEHCVPLGLLCDGIQDCPNGLDEKCGGRNQCEQSFAFCPSGSPDWCISRSFQCDGHNDCSDGSDESLCGSCPASFCLNGGHCNIATEGGRPTCTCPDDASGERCELLDGSSAEFQQYSSASTGWAIAVPVLLILVGVGVLGLLYLRRRRAFP
ncbi:unnamed protein product, partial [Ixodes hexagonus]